MRKKLYITNLNSNNEKTRSEENTNKDIISPNFVSNPKESKTQTIAFFQLFRYSTIWERTLIFIGLISMTISSFGLPFSVIMYGEFTALLVDRTLGVGTSTQTLMLWWFGGGQIITNGTKEENRLALIEDSKAFGLGSTIGAIIQFLTCFIGIDILNFAALKQIKRIRLLFFKSVLSQDMTWYDTVTNTNFSTKITDDLEKIKEGIGEKVAIFIYLIMSFIISVIFSFVYGWKLTLVVLSCAPLVILSTAVVAKVQTSLTEQELISYSSAGNVAEEVFSSIRTVVAFSGETKELNRYKNKLCNAEKTGIRKGLFSGLGGGTMWFITYACFALAFWYGVKLILDDRTNDIKLYTPAVLIIVLFGVLAGAQNLGFASPHIEAFSAAKGAATKIFSLIGQKSLIDPFGKDGLKINNIEGNIEFKDIHFRYPARKDVPILKGLNLKIKAGQNIALVGPSGCGKSTCLQLLQRLYDPLNGNIIVDDIDIKNINTSCYRSFIGVVGQEPILFATSILENIRYGKPDATIDEIEKSAKVANCHDFIINLPNGYETLIGENGTQLSGGQKQRIAIARAIVRNPSILILDEATSALDPTSEKKVQLALEEASKGRTTIVISHRLSTITNSDNIVFIENGVVCEQGTHKELMSLKKNYFNLVNASNSKDKKDPQSPKVRKISLTSLSTASSKESSEFFENQDVKINKDISDEKDYPVSIWRLMKLNSPEWKIILLGSFAAFLQGSSLPIFAILFGEFYGIMSMNNPDDVTHGSILFAILFIVLGILAGVGTFLQTYMFTYAGVKLTSRLRQMTFKTILQQEMAWFDETENSVGTLCARLAGDCASVQGATGARIGSIMQSISTMFIGICISFYYSWNLTLVAIVTIPIVVISVFLDARFSQTSSLDEKKAIEEAARMASEAISNIRTIASLGQEIYVFQRYYNEIEKSTKACRKKIRFRGTVFALGQAVPFLAYAVSFYYGGILAADEKIHYKNVIKIAEALIFGSWMLGQTLAYAPNVNVAMVSAARILRLFDRVPKMHNPAKQPYNMAEKVKGTINYSNVEFHYPTRPDVPVLEGLDLNIKKGTTVALVGPSGCGKSTCIQLLLRYYDPIKGEINLDGVPTIEFPINELRSNLGLVSQEPTLFDRTIAENIAYGDNNRDIPMTEIIEAARKSNIHEFISSLPLGYETSLGTKGAQLSGGQKQRIAIARALVRNPKILLLDEATSALDTHSEIVVQEALDQARTGRTCITIAHRLTTIQNADAIYVLKDGVIIEKGNHNELMSQRGLYARLFTLQQVV